MLKKSQVTVMSMSKWADFIAIDFTPLPFIFSQKLDVYAAACPR